ncbi:hypothetical protein LSAT2_008901 [Lamellibrachia satsuma]|nr:hypothetical protein LSAT2_008901 [Lamellibrachia satsuma]
MSFTCTASSMSWNRLENTSNLMLTLGSTGTIQHVWRKGRAKVFIDGHQWVFNIKALRLIPESDESKSEEE